GVVRRRSYGNPCSAWRHQEIDAVGLRDRAKSGRRPNRLIRLSVSAGERCRAHTFWNFPDVGIAGTNEPLPLSNYSLFCKFEIPANQIGLSGRWEVWPRRQPACEPQSLSGPTV